MELDELTDYIFHARYSTAEELARTIVRFYGYDYGPFKDKPFTAADVVQWYEQKCEKQFYSGWAGYQIGSTGLSLCSAGRFGSCTAEEKALFSSIPYRKKEYDIIFSYGQENAETLRHELSHVIFARDADYNARALQAIAPLVLPAFDLPAFQKHLCSMGYVESNTPKELIARITEYRSQDALLYLSQVPVHYDRAVLFSAKKDLDKLFKTHWRKIVFADRWRKAKRLVTGSEP